MTITITLPHTDKALSPNNGHVHRMAHWRAFQAAKELARTTMEAALDGEPFAPATYAVRWWYKGSAPDLDNVLARCKAYIDGACLAMGVDDSTLEDVRVFRQHDKAMAGRVQLTFYDDSQP